MTDRTKRPGALAGATGAEGLVQCPAGKGKLARQKRAVTFTVTPHDADAAPMTIAVSGRVLWALGRLVEAGGMGLTAISEPAPRWSAYIHTLRGLGVPIETVTEPHDGPFPGTHAKYVLHARVSPATEGGASDGKAV